jgi:lycopene beta-cyclase
MTYFTFLGIFLFLPLIIVFCLTWLDARKGRRLPAVLDTWPAWVAVLLHIFIALAYTTLWDNYLVASGVWYYDPQRVTGLTIGWVPIEEYTFFVLQTLLAGFWWIYLAKRVKLAGGPVLARVGLRVGASILLGLLVVTGIFILVSGNQPGRYAALILVWALPPIMIQIGWGGHILWHYRRLVLTALASVTLYLAAADLLAIGLGIWTIDPQQSYNIFLLGVLPIEEFIFFLVTNTLIIFGVTLAVAQPSLDQFKRLKESLRARRNRKDIPTRGISNGEL